MLENNKKVVLILFISLLYSVFLPSNQAHSTLISCIIENASRKFAQRKALAIVGSSGGFRRIEGMIAALQMLNVYFYFENANNQSTGRAQTFDNATPESCRSGLRNRMTSKI